MTQRDGMGREVGGGFRMGNTCIPVSLGMRLAPGSTWHMHPGVFHHLLMCLGV